jgi:hypothetical protein
LNTPLRILILAALASASPAVAAEFDYTFDVPARQTARYEVPFEVLYPGTLGVEISWDTSRVLSFRVETPGESPTVFRRSGPSPQRFLIEVTDPGDEGELWKLAILGLPSRTATTGQLRISLPDPPGAVEEPVDAAPAVTDDVAPWEQPVRTPEGLSRSWDRLFASSEELRALLIDSDEPSRDACRWQTPMLQYLTAQRQAHASGGVGLDETTRKMLTRIAEAVREVGTLEHTRDPVLNAPAPRDFSQRRAWQVLRNRRLDPIRRSLDLIFSDLQTGHAPSLGKEEWPARYISCLMACEREFEERTNRSVEEPSPGMLIELEWPRIQAAAEALAALAAVD